METVAFCDGVSTSTLGKCNNVSPSTLCCLWWLLLLVLVSVLVLLVLVSLLCGDGVAVLLFLLASLCGGFVVVGFVVVVAGVVGVVVVVGGCGFDGVVDVVGGGGGVVVVLVGSGVVVGVILSLFVFCSKVIHLKKSCLFVWINYRQEQILKVDRKDKAGIFSKKRLLKVFFIKWKNKVSLNHNSSGKNGGGMT